MFARLADELEHASRGDPRSRARRRRRPLPRSAARMTTRTAAAGASCVRSCAHGVVARRVAPVRRRRRLGWSIDDDRARLTATARRLGYDVAPAPWARFARAAGRVPSRPLRRVAASLARLVARARSQLLPRTARNAGLSGVRPRVRGAEAPRGTHRPRAGDARGDAASSCSRPGSIRRGCSGFRSASTSSTFRSSTSPAGRARERARIPQSAFVVGSFLKDGVGLGERQRAEAASRGRTRSSACSRGCANRSRSSSSSLTGPARGYVRTELERRRHPVPPRVARLARRVGRGVSRARRDARDLAPGGRAQGGARVDGRRRAARRRRGSARRRSSSSTATTACWRTSTTSTRWSAAVSTSPRRRGACEQAAASAAGRRRRRTRRSGSTVAGRSCSTASCEGTPCG